MLIPLVLLVFYVQYRMKSTLGNYSRVFNSRNITGADVTRQRFDKNRLFVKQI
jgi:Zn-dependent membrane protease YugP